MRVSKLYGAGVTGRLMKGQYGDPVHAWFQNRHAQHAKTLINAEGYYVSKDGNHSWKVPYGIKHALRTPLIHVQLINQYPWTVTWAKKGKRYRKYFNSIASAMEFIATKAQYKDPHACIVSRQRHYDIPPTLRGKIPLPFKWCPRCLAARRFYRVLLPSGKPETFHGQIKQLNEKGYYEWRERLLALTRCKHCGTTNRNVVFRRSNQPWETRVVRPGKTRVKRRRA